MPSEGDGAAADCSEAMVEKVLRVWQKIAGVVRGALVDQVPTALSAEERQRRWGRTTFLEA